MTTFGSRLSTCHRVLQKERLLTYGVDSPGQSRGISPLQGVVANREPGSYMISPSSNLQATAITVQTEEYEPGWNNLVPLESRIGTPAMQ